MNRPEVQVAVPYAVAGPIAPLAVLLPLKEGALAHQRSVCVRVWIKPIRARPLWTAVEIKPQNQGIDCSGRRRNR